MGDLVTGVCGEEMMQKESREDNGEGLYYSEFEARTKPCLKDSIDF